MGLFSGRAGLVSGAAGGIGRATAVALGREGASVLVTDIEAMRAEGEETVALVEKEGGRASFLATDVARADDVRRMVDTTVELFGSLDFAHNNAGVLATGFTADVDEADFDRIMEIDVKGVWLSMKYELLHMMRHGGGVIVNTASEAGLVGTPMAGPYVAAKHAVIGLTKTAAGEYANMGIRINAVAPRGDQQPDGPRPSRSRAADVDGAPAHAPLRHPRGGGRLRGVPLFRPRLVHHRNGSVHRRGRNIECTVLRSGSEPDGSDGGVTGSGGGGAKISR